MKINPSDLDKWSDNSEGKFERIKRKKPVWNKQDKKRDKNFKPKHDERDRDFS